MNSNILQDKILICDETLEGVFTAIYEAYEWKENHERIEIQIRSNKEYRLFATYKESIADSSKSEKVARTISREFGEEAYNVICRALATTEPDRADMVYHGIVVGLTMKNKRTFLDNLANPYINKIFSMSRFTNNEIMHLHGFLRFQELENGLLFSKIGPKNNILTFIAPHFADRLCNENFMIFDENRKLCIIHPKKRAWILVAGDIELVNLESKYSANEEVYQTLFRYFCEKIAIKERINPKLQQQMLPLRYQEYMIEFQ